MFFSAITVGKWLYLIGGENGETELFRYSNVERAEIYPVHGTFSQWTIIRDLPFYIYLHAGVSYGKYVYLLGGFVGVNADFGYDSNSVFRVKVSPDGSISEFTAETAAMRAVHEVASALVFGDYIYVFCGDNGNSIQPSVERAKILPDGHLSAWTTLNYTQYTHDYCRCAIAQDTHLFLVAGYYGTINGQITSPVEYATVDTAGNLSSWRLANMTYYPVDGTAVVLANPYIYLPAGWIFINGRGDFMTDTLCTRFLPTAVEPNRLWELYQ